MEWNKVENDVFIGPGVQFCNDKYPRNKIYVQPIDIPEKGCSIGAGATILPGITIGKNSIVGAGSVVTRDVRRILSLPNPARSIPKSGKID